MMAIAEEINEWSRSWTLIPIDEWLRQRAQRNNYYTNDRYHGHSGSHEDSNVSSGGLTAADPSSSDDSRCQEEASWAQMRIVSKTKLPDGRLSLLADIGSRINIVGCNTEQEFS